MRRLILVTVLAAAPGLVAGGSVRAQQPNSAIAALSVNAVFAGPPFPIPVGGLQNTVVAVTLQGAAGAGGTPFLLASGRVLAGAAVFPEGILDLDFGSPGFAFLLNGFDPTSPLGPFSFLNPASSFSGAFFYAPALTIPAGLQALLVNPTVPAGLRLTAAADFAPATPNLLSANAAGAGAPIWQNNGGAITTPPVCAPAVFLNGEITFVFGGAVNPASLPAAGPAVGSITIAAAGTPTPAVGTFSVRDDPRLAPGNGRVVSFTPQAPAGAPACGTAGLLPGTTYQVLMAGAGSPGPVLVVGGLPLATSVTTCFTTRACGPLGPGGPFVDPSPGPPVVVGSTPVMASVAPPPVPAGSIAGNTVTITVSEALRPDTIDLSTVRLVNQTSGGQVPGSLVFFQSGSIPGTSQSRIDYVAAEALPHGCVYRLEVAPAVTDLAGNPLELVAGQPGQPIFFATQVAPPVAQPPIVENFQSAANAAQVGPNLVWGGGSLSLVFDASLTGNGAFGTLAFPSGPATIDTGQPTIVAGGLIAFSAGAWNTTALTVSPGANVRIIGPNRAHIRCQGTATVEGVLNGNAGTNPTAPLGSPDQGARPGQFNNGNPGNPQVVAGGVAGTGGGDGGRASQADATGPALRTPSGEAGFGPRIAAQPNPGPFGANPTYGGGAGGQGGFLFPQGGLPGEVGGLGGAGGSSFVSGANGGPNSAAPACAPVPVSTQSRALATGTTAAMTPPIIIDSAGSGGGGGGDKFDPAGVNGDDQGGGGGGGGGGIRISAGADISLLAGTSISMNAASGGQGNVFQGGHGGGGSGGQIWLQSLGQVIIATTALLQVSGGSANNACGNQAGGRGGDGLYQFEDSDGIVNTLFPGAPAGGTNIVTLAIASGFSSSATSVLFNTGNGNPTYIAGAATSIIGAGAVSIAVQGAHSLVSNPNQPDLTTLTAPVPLASVATLSGRRFIRFVATLSYPPGTLPTATLPSVQSITISFSV